MKESISYYIQHDNHILPKAVYVLEVLFEIIGVRLTRTNELTEEVDLVYSEKNPDVKYNGLWIKAMSLDEWASADYAVKRWNNQLFVVNQDPMVSSDFDVIHFDILYSCYVILTGGLENRQKRDNWGVPEFNGSYAQTSGLLECPSIHEIGEYLFSCLIRKYEGGIRRIALWPDGKSMAIVLSHDVDQPFSKPTLTRYFLKKSVREMSVYNLKSLLKVSTVEVWKGFKNDITNDPNFCFNGWMELENTLNAKSAFYVAVKTSADKGASPFDVQYNFRDKNIVNALNSAINKGWEVGLHASINAKQELSNFIEEKHQLEKVIDGYQIAGIRHHYFSVDVKEEKTFHMHKAAGFKYDSSLGMNDAVGFRRGMMLPFYPFDEELNQPIELLQIPQTLMDGGIFYFDVTVELGIERIKHHLDVVKKYHGAAVLNWHLEQLNFSLLRGAGKALVDVMNNLVGADDIFWTTPIELTNYWLRRKESLKMPNIN